MLGIVTALPMERGWLGSVDGRIGPAIEVCGAGSRRAREAARRLLAMGVTALASWGTAAGLRSAVAAGTVVLPREVMDPGHRLHTVDPAWHGRLLRRLGDRVEVSTGALVHAPQLLETTTAKAELGARSGAVAADMESAAVAATAADGNVPFLAVRVVLDGPDSPLPATVSRAFDGAGRVRPAVLWRSVLTHPEEWGHLFELARSYRLARRAMVELWRLAGPDLALDEPDRTATTDGGSASL